jgi:hypothetical protein
MEGSTEAEGIMETEGIIETEGVIEIDGGTETGRRHFQNQKKKMRNLNYNILKAFL